MNYGFEWYTSIAVLVLFFSFPIIAGLPSKSNYSGMSSSNIIVKIIINLGKISLVFILGIMIAILVYFLTNNYALVLGLAPVVGALLIRYLFKSSNSEGSTLIGQEDGGDIFQLHDKVAEFEPKNEVGWNFRGNILRNEGKLEEALTTYNEALDLNQEFYLAWIGKAFTLEELGRLEDALESYEKVLEVKPELQKVWYNKASILHKLGRYEDALTAVEEGLDYNRNSSILKKIKKNFQNNQNNILKQVSDNSS